MRTKPIVSLVFSLLLAGLARADGAQLPPDQLFKQVSPGVVTILTEDEDGARAGSGSGFFVDVVETPKRDPRALVATNYHVIQYAAGAVVIMEADLLDSLPDELRQLFDDLGINPETVREVMRNGGVYDE